MTNAIKPTLPDDYFKVKFNRTPGSDEAPEPKELFMSFTAINALTSVVGSIENIGAISSEPTMREYVIMYFLYPRDADGKLPELFTDAHLDEINITRESAQDLLKWVTEHVLDFFIQAAESLIELQESHKDQLIELQARNQKMGPEANSTNSPDGSTD